ncbi:hypothetical protein TRIUR3_24592 [Triticum urartu]|uniref:Uncharacterized protein n=1 Tax=Triticum urartu TaxID=4572 RepID=M7Z2E5_TRIUA|nr:hypothetical protein TRIUR3_24592 [Triticum urartu]
MTTAGGSAEMKRSSGGSPVEAYEAECLGIAVPRPAYGEGETTHDEGGLAVHSWQRLAACHSKSRSKQP